MIHRPITGTECINIRLIVIKYSCGFKHEKQAALCNTMCVMCG